MSDHGQFSSLHDFWELLKETANPHTMHTEDLTAEQLQKMASYESFDYHKAYPDMYMAYLRDNRVGTGESASSVYPLLEFQTSAEKREKETTILRWLLHVLTAFTVSIVAALVAYTVDNLEEYRAGTLSTIVLSFKVPVVGRVLGFFFWLLTAVALVMVGTAVVVFVEPAAAGGGIPDVMAYLNGVHVRKAMNIKTFAVKVLSCICAVASGLPVGLEAPLIHLGAITGAGVTQGRSTTLGIQTNLFQRFRNHRDRRAFITVGAACGVSAAFGAPIGGLLFVMEEISSFWDHSASGEIFLASMISVTVTNMINSLVEEGKLLGWVSHTASVLFEVNISIPFNLKSIIPALFLGSILGAFAALFTKLNIILIKWRKVNIRPLLLSRFLEPVLVVAVYTTATYFFSWASDCRSIKPITDVNETIHQWGTEPSSRLFTDTCSNTTDSYSPFGTLNMATGKNAIRHLFSRQTAGQFPVYYLFLYFLMYSAFACISSGMAISGGLVVPSLVIGAAFGRLYGLTLWYIFSKNVSIEHAYRSEDAWLDPGLFALIGAAAFLAGTSRLGISVCVIMVELSSELRYLLPIMVAIVMSKSVANWLCEPLYHHILHLDCVPFLSNHIPSPEFEQLTAADVMVPTVVTLRLVEETKTLWSALETTHHAFPIVEEIEEEKCDDEKGDVKRTKKKSKFCGLVTRDDLQVLLSLPHLRQSNDAEGTTPSCDGPRPASGVMNQMSYREWIHHKYEIFFRNVGSVGDSYIAALHSTVGTANPPDIVDHQSLPDVVDLSLIVNRSPWVIPPFFNLQMAYETFSMMGLRHMVVVDGEEVCGIITRKNLLPDALRRKLKEMKRRINDSGVVVESLSSRTSRLGGGSAPSSHHGSRTSRQGVFATPTQGGIKKESRKSSFDGSSADKVTSATVKGSRELSPSPVEGFSPLSPKQLEELFSSSQH